MYCFKKANILHVDLTTGVISRRMVDLPEETFYLCRASALDLLSHFSPEDNSKDMFENLAIFSPGALAGTLFPGAGRTHIVVAQRNHYPLLGSLGGNLAAAIKNGGYDHIVVTGRANRLCYLYVHDDLVEIRDALEFAGSPLQEIYESLAEELDNEEFSFAGIGAAGEKHVASAVIQEGFTCSSSPGGTGAVLGAMNLKALVAVGTQGIVVRDNEEFLGTCKAFGEKIRAGQSNESKFNGAAIKGSHASRPKRWGNWSWSFDNSYKTGGVACHGCPVRCYGNYHLPSIGKGVLSSKELLTLSQEFGPDNGTTAFAFALLCQRVGVDSQNFLALVKLLMEHQGGPLPHTELSDSHALHQYSLDTLELLLEKTLLREGVGSVLAQGREGVLQLLGLDVDGDMGVKSLESPQRDFSSIDLMKKERELAEVANICERVNTGDGSLSKYLADALSSGTGREFFPAQLLALANKVSTTEEEFVRAGSGNKELKDH